MNIDPALRLLPGSIVLLLFVAVTAGRGEGGVPGEPPLDSTPGPLGYVLICNATTETIRYRRLVPGHTREEHASDALPRRVPLVPGWPGLHLPVRAAGAVNDSLLRRGTIYAFRDAGGKPSGPVTLVAVSRTGWGPTTPVVSAPPRSAAIAPQPREAPAPVVATRRELELELTIKRLEAEVKRLSNRPTETRPAVEKAAVPRGIGLHWSGRPVRLGPLDLSAGAAEAELTLTLERDPDTAPTALKLAADFKPARGRARVRPETTEMPPDGVLKLALAFEGVPAAAMRVGKLIVLRANSPQDRGLVIPITVTFRSRLPVLMRGWGDGLDPQLAARRRCIPGRRVAGGRVVAGAPGNDARRMPAPRGPVPGSARSARHGGRRVARAGEAIPSLRR